MGQNFPFAIEHPAQPINRQAERCGRAEAHVFEIGGSLHPIVDRDPRLFLVFERRQKAVPPAGGFPREIVERLDGERCAVDCVAPEHLSPEWVGMRMAAEHALRDIGSRIKLLRAEGPFSPPQAIRDCLEVVPDRRRTNPLVGLQGRRSGKTSFQRTIRLIVI